MTSVTAQFNERVLLLQSEIPSGMCAKLAPWQQATIEITRRDHSRRYHQEIQSTVNQVHKHFYRSLTKITPSGSLYYCLFTPHTCIFVLSTHPVRGESHNQRNTTGEVATTSPPFYNEPHRSHVLCVKAELGTTSTSW